MDVAAEFRAWILVGVHHHYYRNCQNLPINYGVVLFLYNESSLKFDMPFFWLQSCAKKYRKFVCME
jgi:hypothetical protein